MKKHYIKNEQELLELQKIAKSIVNESDNELQKSDKLSVYTHNHIKHLASMPEDRAWYEASAYETLVKFGIGNCKNFAQVLIALAYSIGINGRKVYICGKVEGQGEQGHVICELKINGKWLVFDAMYGVPFLTEKTNPDDLPSAQDCYKNGKLYWDLINPKYIPKEQPSTSRGHPETMDFWIGIWNGRLEIVETGE